MNTHGKSYNCRIIWVNGSILESILEFIADESTDDGVSPLL
jgi:hypothetical protein